MIASSTAESRAHPDPSMDVWELAVWDPLPICLRLFCLFSPGHVLVYWLFLPTATHDPRPSTTVLTTIILSGLLSIQLLMLQTHFSQQNKDTAMIHKEVLNEYDTKFVHPRTTSLVRDVGTQYDDARDDINTNDSPDYPRQKRKSPLRFVHTYTPTTVIHRGFQIHPNPNYAKHYDPEGITTAATGGGNMNGVAKPRRTTGFQTPTYSTTAAAAGTTPAADMSSPVRPRQAAMRQPLFQQASSTGINASSNNNTSGDGGSLGVYSHANSPLKKQNRYSAGIGAGGGGGGGGGGLGVDYNHHRRSKSPMKREGSPLKKSSIPQESAMYGGYHPVSVSSGLSGGGGGGGVSGGDDRRVAGTGMGMGLYGGDTNTFLKNPPRDTMASQHHRRY